MKNICITAASRTAVGSLGKSSKNIRADELGSAVISSVIHKSKLKKDEIDEIIMGQVLTSGAGQNPGRRDPEVEHPGLFVSSTNFANLTFKLCVYSVWLLGYEFSDTLVLFTREKVVFAVSQKKSKFRSSRVASKKPKRA